MDRYFPLMVGLSTGVGVLVSVLAIKWVLTGSLGPRRRRRH